MPDTLSPKRRWLFWTIIALFVVLLPLAVLETAVRVSGIRVADDPYLQFGPVQPFFIKQTISGRRYYQAAKRELYRERNIVFPIKKDPGTFRVFCLGASASAGWPHPSQEIYSEYLEEALLKAYPGQKIEVINVSAHSYPTYRVRMIFEEILQFKPDLLIISITTGGVYLNDEEKGQIGGSNVVGDAGDDGNGGSTAQSASGLTGRLLSFAPFQSSSGECRLTGPPRGNRFFFSLHDRLHSTRNNRALHAIA